MAALSALPKVGTGSQPVEYSAEEETELLTAEADLCDVIVIGTITSRQTLGTRPGEPTADCMMAVTDEVKDLVSGADSTFAFRTFSVIRIPVIGEQWLVFARACDDYFIASGTSAKIADGRISHPWFPNRLFSEHRSIIGELVEPSSLVWQRDAAHWIVRGQLVERSTQSKHSSPDTQFGVIKLELSEVLKGSGLQAPDTLAISIPESGRNTIGVAGSLPRLVVGHEYLLFLDQSMHLQRSPWTALEIAADSALVMSGEGYCDYPHVLATFPLQEALALIGE